MSARPDLADLTPEAAAAAFAALPPCPHRTDPRPGRVAGDGVPEPVATCGLAAILPQAGRPCAVGAGFCRRCERDGKGPGWTKNARSISLSFQWRGRGPFDLAPASLAAAVPPPPGRVPPASPLRWAVGVRTCPRAGTNYLPRTLEQLAAAGWPDPHVFAEPGSEVPRGVRATVRGAKLGGWGSWYAALADLAMSQPEATAYLLAEDDILLPAGVRRHLEDEVLWPDGSPDQLLSLYTSGPHEADAGGVPGWHARVLWRLGTLAVVLSPSALRRVLADPATVAHRWHGAAPDRDEDGVLGDAAARMGRPVYHPVPSLAWHAGDVSAMYPGAGAADHRQAKSYAGFQVAAPPPRPVKVAFLAHVLLVGGMERWILSLLAHLDRTKVEPVAVGVLSGEIDPAVRAEVERFCPVVPGAAAALAKADVLVASCVGELPLLLPSGHGAPVVLVSHGAPGWTTEVFRRAAGAVTHCAAVSELAARAVPRELGLPVEVIPNGVDLDRVGWHEHGPDWARLTCRLPPAPQLVVGYLGRYSEEKNPGAVVAALAELPGAYGLFVGRGDLQGPLIADAARYGVADRCVWHDPVARVGDVFSAMSCLVFPSKHEGFGLTLVEAWAAGLPTVATATGVVEEAEAAHGPLCVRIPHGAAGPVVAAAVRRAIAAANEGTVARAKRVAREHYSAARMARGWSEYLANVGRAAGVAAIAGPAAAPADLAAARLAVCAKCPRWDQAALRCRCSAIPPDEVFGPAAIAKPESRCPRGLWQAAV